MPAAALVDPTLSDARGRPILLLTVGVVATILVRARMAGAVGVAVGALLLPVLALLRPGVNLVTAVTAVLAGAVLALGVRGLRPDGRLQTAADPAVVALLTVLVTTPVAAVVGLTDTSAPAMWLTAWAGAVAGTLLILLPAMCWRGRPGVRHGWEFTGLVVIVALLVVGLTGPGVPGFDVEFGAWLLLPITIFAGVRYGVFPAALLIAGAEFAVVATRQWTHGIPPPDDLVQPQLVAILLLTVSVTVLLLLRQQRDSLYELRSSREITGAFMRYSEPMWYVKLLDLQGVLRYERLGGNAFRGWHGIADADDTELFGEESPGQLAQKDESVLRTETASVDVENLRLPDGSTRTFLTNRFPIRDNNGRPIGVGGVRSDITDREAQAKLVAEQARLLEAMFGSAPVPTMRVAATGDHAITAANTALALVCGRDQADLVGLPLRDLVGEENWDDVAALFQRASSGRAGPRWHPQAEVRIPVVGLPDRVALLAVGQLSSPDVVGDELHDQFVVHLEDVTARRAAEDAVKRHSLFDPATGLLNRVALDDRLDAQLHRIDDDGPRLALIVCDVDDFKSVNDYYGHPFGDAVLLQVADRLQAAAPQGSAVARLGSDEFALLVEQEGEQSVGVLVGALQQVLSQPIVDTAGEVSLTASFGVAPAEESQLSSVELVRRAELALFLAKRNGRGRVEFYAESMRAQAQAVLNVRKELHYAIAQRTFTVHYQPIVDLLDGSVVSYEVLVRLPARDGRVLGPLDFLPVARSADMIGAIDRIVLRTALADLAAQRLPHPAAELSVNCEAQDLRDPDYALNVLAQLHSFGIDPDRVTLEVTESALLQVGEQVLDNVRSLREAGVRLAIDDFGTGYSSLSQLRNLNVDILKIDRSFVSEMTTDPEAANIVATVVALAHRLGLAVIAEGIETREQAEALRRLGCERGQGYLFGRPEPVKAPEPVPEQRGSIGGQLLRRLD